MKVLTSWLRSYLPELPVSDAQLAEDLTLRGIAVEGIFDLAPLHGPSAGSLFEMDITTNRVDAMNHYGIAREAATIYGLPLKPLETALPTPTPAPSPYPVRIADDAKALCGRFTARILRGITIQPSSGLVAERFRLLEQKQISNAVDATNYVTQAIGQPTHAFDLDTLSGGADGIVVRRARPGERLRTLDGIERTLDPDDLVIADQERALSLAGIMGGWDSRITPATRNVLVEAAWFDPATIRRSSKRHLLHTDASHRFERGADFHAAAAAAALVSRLLLESGGSLEGELIDLIEPDAARRTADRAPISLSLSEVHRILGPTDAPQGITAEDVRTILTGLGCTLSASVTTAVTNSAPDPASVTVTDLNSPALTHTAPGTTHPDPQASHPAGPRPTQADPQARHPERSEGSAVASLSSTAAEAHPDLAQRETYAVTLPSWRLDLDREIDLIEEIARVYGYNRFQTTLPAFTGTVRQLPHAAGAQTLRRTLLAAGLSEAVSSTFCSATDAVTFSPQPNSAAAIENPLSEEAGMLRPSLLPGMLTMLAANLHRDVQDVALFELGTIFTATGSRSETRSETRSDTTSEVGHPPRDPSSNGRANDRSTDRANDRANDRVDERPSLAIGLAGTLGAHPADFYTLKGIVEQLATRFAARSTYYDRFAADSGLMPAWLHPGRSARLVVDGTTIGYFGQLHPAEAQRRKLKATLYLAELRADRLYAQGLRHPMPRELSRFQPVRRDFSFLLPEATEYAHIEQTLRALALEELTSFAPAELLHPAQSPQIPAGHLSLLLATTFQSQTRTLRDEDLQTYAQQIIAAVETLGGRLRS